MVFIFIVAMMAAMVVGTLIWRGMARPDSRRPDGRRPARPERARAVAPDDDPEFLRRLGEQLRSEGEDPPARR
jgi:hypothetical protein